MFRRLGHSTRKRKFPVKLPFHKIGKFREFLSEKALKTTTFRVLVFEGWPDVWEALALQPRKNISCELISIKFHSDYMFYT